MKCPNCGAEGTGKFCAQCGAALGANSCGNCGAALPRGARFCTQCGTATTAPRQPAGALGGSNLPWYLAGAVLLVLAIILLLPMLRDAAGSASPGAVPATQGNGAPGPLLGTPRSQADQLFNRIMREREGGNLEQAKFFSSMGIQAYQNAEPLDDDGLYHLALIQLVADDHAGARATADRILSRNPNHLLGLFMAAEAAAAAGDSATARPLYQRFLDSYQTEIAKGLQEYQDHSAIFPEYRDAAQAAVRR